MTEPTMSTLTHHLDWLESGTLWRLLVIVSNEDRELYESLKRSSAAKEAVKVILDRRRGEQSKDGERLPERRRGYEIRTKRVVLLSRDGTVIWKAP